MTGPRLFARAHLLALAALLLLPACSPRKPIPSDPPEVRTEAQVRGAARAAAQPVAAAEPQAAPETKAVVAPEPEAKPAETKPDVLVARASEESKPAQAAAAEDTALAGKAVETKAEAAKAVEAQAAEVQAAEAKASEAKVAEAKPAAVTAVVPAPDAETTAQAAKAKAAEVTAKTVKPKAEADSASKVAQDTKTIIAEVTAQAGASAQPEKGAPQEAAQEAVRPAIVQIASFNTEKNAQGALSWLKEKGYSESRVVRVEQGLTVYHRVQAGPFQDLDAARKALEELKITWPQAFIPAD